MKASSVLLLVIFSSHVNADARFDKYEEQKECVITYYGPNSKSQVRVSPKKEVSTYQYGNLAVSTMLDGASTIVVSIEGQRVRTIQFGTDTKTSANLSFESETIDVICGYTPVQVQGLKQN